MKKLKKFCNYMYKFKDKIKAIINKINQCYKKYIIRFASLFKYLLIPVSLVKRYSHRFIVESELDEFFDIFFRKSKNSKQEKFNTYGFVVGSAILVGAIIFYVNTRNVTGILYYIIMYLIVVCALLSINLICAAFGKNIWLIRICCGISIFPIFFIFSILSLVFKIIKIDLIIKYIAEITLSLLSAGVICYGIIFELLKLIDKYPVSIHQEFITAKTVVRILVLFILVVIDKVTSWMLKIMFSIKESQENKRDKSEVILLKKEKDKFFKQCTLLKFILLLIATFFFKVADFDTPITYYQQEITSIETRFKEDNSLDNQIKQLEKQKSQYKLKVKNYENNKILIDSLFYATGFMTLYQTVKSVRSEQDDDKSEKID